MGAVNVRPPVGLTPPSGKRISEKSAPDNYGGHMPDGESPNCCDAFDGSAECMPLKEKDYMDNACGIE